MQLTSTFAIATSQNRDYITPEDISDAIENGATYEQISCEYLQAMTSNCEFGIEDKNLSAFVILDRFKKI